MKEWEIALVIIANMVQAIAILFTGMILFSFILAMAFILVWVFLDRKLNVKDSIGGKE